MKKETKKVLFSANLDSFFTKFLLPQLKYFKEQGYEVHIASKKENIDIPYCDKKFDVSFARSLSIRENINSFKQMKKILINEHYDIISCHTPFGGAITRLAAKVTNVSKKGTKIVYMAHGFHFYKGAPFINWLLYYHAEKYLAKYTDILITINRQDYEIAKKHFATQVRFVNGVGLDVKKFQIELTKEERNNLRTSLKLKEDDFVLIYSAELLPRKRQIWLLDTLSSLLQENNNIHLLLPGRDSMNGKCQKFANKKGISSNVHFLDFREDIPQLLKISDLAVSSSKQEGLPVNIMEAMYCGLPIVASDCRGNSDLIENGKNGFIIPLNDKVEFANKVKRFVHKEENIENFKKSSQAKIENYLIEPTMREIVKIYNELS